MRKAKSIKYSLCIRFRRWSRMSFAAFCSIGRCVVISRVCNSIADASLTKNGLPEAEHILVTPIEFNCETTDEEIPIPQNLVQINILQALTTASKEVAAALHIHTSFKSIAPSEGIRPSDGAISF